LVPENINIKKKEKKTHRIKKIFKKEAEEFFLD